MEKPRRATEDHRCACRHYPMHFWRRFGRLLTQISQSRYTVMRGDLFWAVLQEVGAIFGRRVAVCSRTVLRY
jgi:hypothetical protein